MKRYFLFGCTFVSLFGIEQVSAEDYSLNEPINLWGVFTTDTAKAEIKAFKATKPKKRVEIYADCWASMLHRHNKGKLVSIIFLGQDNNANCFQRMYDDLSGRYGEPELANTTFGGVIAYGSNGASIDTTSSGVVNIWREADKKTKLVKTPGNGYNLIFTIRPDKYIH
jgi:hypothetical protein